MKYTNKKAFEEFGENRITLSSEFGDDMEISLESLYQLFKRRVIDEINRNVMAIPNTNRSA